MEHDRINNIVLFDTYQGSLNEGDAIIKQYINEEMNFLFNNSNIARFSTHQQIGRFYQFMHKNVILKACQNADYKFLCGTNLFHTSLLRLSPNWNLNITGCSYYKNSIAIGCGMNVNSKRVNYYTKFLYKHILAKDIIHSTRDRRTKEFIESLGFRAINTGCPTLWGLTKELCHDIPNSKSKNVIFTLTDYKRDYKNDKIFIDILRRNYEKLYFWIQGYDDYNYLNSITNSKDITIIPHELINYEHFLNEVKDVEFVGTRLHAGIYAMRHKKRSVILSVDNRAEDMKNSYNLNVISRKDISSKLDNYINSEFNTDIKIPFDDIQRWKDQFR